MSEFTLFSVEMEKKFLQKENFSPEFRKFMDQKYQKHFSPEEIFAYIYAILHSPTYREEYFEELQNDFPSIPFVDEVVDFQGLAKLGSELMQKHLFLEMPQEKKYQQIGIFEGEGENKVLKVKFRNEKCYINENQYFSNISKEIFEFKIGNYFVIEKFLKERKNSCLSQKEVEKVSQITQILAFTIDKMQEIDTKIQHFL